MENPPFIYGIGKNYADHTAEMGELKPSGLIVFAKNPGSIIQNGEPIIIPRCCKDELDFEKAIKEAMEKDYNAALKTHNRNLERQKEILYKEYDRINISKYDIEIFLKYGR